MARVVFCCATDSLESSIIARKSASWYLSSKSITLSDLRRALSGNRCRESGNSESRETHDEELVVESKRGMEMSFEDESEYGRETSKGRTVVKRKTRCGEKSLT